MIIGNSKGDRVWQKGSVEGRDICLGMVDE